MSETAVPLDPLTVRAREHFDLGPLSGYYERVQRHERMGFGHIMTRDELRERDALDVVDILREIPRIAIANTSGRGNHVMFRGGGTGQCTPKVYINGVHVNRNALAYIDELVRPTEIEGIEVYRGLTEMPGEFYDETHCGVILVWTRRDAEGGRPFAWKRVLLTMGGILGASFLLFR
jgi:outer membrane cobalamin receptor